MSNTIKLKRGSGSDPSASDLSVGELAIRTDNGKIFTKKDNGSVAEISGGGGGIDDGDKGDITVSNGGDTWTIDSGVISTGKIANNAVNLSKLFQHNLNGFIATNANSDCTVPTFPTHSGDTFIVHDLQLNRDSSNNDPVISPGSQATITFKTSTSASGAFGSILDGTGLQLGRNTEYVKLAAPQDQSGQASYTLTFPPTSGSANQFLQTNGSGTTSWASVAFLSQNQVIALYDQSSTPVQRVLVGTEGMTIQGTSAAVSKLMFRDRTTANFLKFKPVDTLSDDVEFTLPSADGSANTVLKTDGSGVLSFGTIETASISDDAVTLAKIQNVASQTILGRTSTGTGEVAALSAANARAILNVENGATADQTAAEIRTLVGNASDSNVFTDALLSKLNGIAASATNVTNNNQLTNGAGYITATLTQEQVEDFVGGMLTGNTETGITVTYQDSDGTIDFVVASQTDNNFTDADHAKLDGIAAGATNVTNTNQLTNGAGFITGSGNAATATTATNVVGVANSSNTAYRVPFLSADTGTAAVYTDTSSGITYNPSTNTLAAGNFSGNGSSVTNVNAATLDSLDSTQFLRSDANDTATGTLTVRDILLSSGYHLMRSNHHSGHLEGSYNNVGANSTKSNPIYTIGSSYNPTDSALSNMYGIGYTHTNASFISFTGASGWGMYVAADGDARIYLGGSNGVISSTGQHYVGSDVVWNAGNDGDGSGLDADTVDGLNASSFLRSDASDSMTGTLTIGDGSAQTELHIKKADNNVPDHLQFYNGTTLVGEIGVSDTSWLRINNVSTANIYTPRIIRADGGFQVDGVTVINGSAQLIASRLTGALPAIDGSALTGISAGGATGGGSDEVFYENSQTVTTSYTITNGKNAMAAGPITINSGVTVTVGSGETLTIV